MVVVAESYNIPWVVPCIEMLPSYDVMPRCLLCIVAPDGALVCFGFDLDLFILLLAKSLKLSPLGSVLGLGLGSENHAIIVAAST